MYMHAHIIKIMSIKTASSCEGSVSLASLRLTFGHREEPKRAVSLPLRTCEYNSQIGTT